MKDLTASIPVRWYALEFNAVRFRAVFALLNNLDVEWYCPMKQVLRKRTGRIHSYVKRECPLFPGYLFVRIDFNLLHPSQVTKFADVRRFVSFGDEPVPVADETIAQVKSAGTEDYLWPADTQSTDHQFAAILLTEDPLKRNLSLLHYLVTSNLRNATQD